MSIPVCRFYQSQTCRFGKNCRYLHPSSQRPPPKLELKQGKDGSLNYDPTYPVAALALSDGHTRQFNSDHNEGTLNQRSATRQAQSLHSRDSQEVTSEEHGTRLVSANKPVNKSTCHYFQTYGNCRHGNECRFLHIKSDREDSSQQRAPSRRQNGHRNLAEIPPRFRKNADEVIGIKIAGTEDVVPEHVKKQEYKQNRGRAQRDGDRQSPHAERRVCPYFRRGYCNRGDYCRFVHSSDRRVEVKVVSTDECENTQEDEDDLEDTSSGRVTVVISDQLADTEQPRKTTSSSIIRPVIIKQRFTYAELDNIDLVKVRDSEISTIKKRFPRDKITVVEETTDKFAARVLFSPTDPDWAFDVRIFDLLLTVPSDYPKQMLKVQLPVDQNLPETVRRYIEISITEWLEQKMEQLAADGKVELMFRPFLLWLDRNIEDITMEALKQLKRELVAHAAGMEFIPAHRLQARLRATSEHMSDDEAHSGDSQDLTSSASDSADDDDDDESSDDINDSGVRPKLNLDPEKKGTEIELRHLQLRENASALLFERLKLILQCGRCKNHSDILVVPGKVMSVVCDKCNQNQFVHFRAALIHQFSSVAGYLDLDGCQAFDLIFQDCRVAVTCMGCSKQTRVDGLVTGHLVDAWCQACNARFKLATEAVKFLHLAPSSVDTSNGKVVEIGPTKHKKAAKDAAIREGYPLPEFGTCKHYKHSYRWLRFPCCGKAYPCDTCHDSKEDHEMVYATRMICGHCCKEQNFSATRPCGACGQHLTKIRTAHWEGGSGCRDKVSMSKSDQQKYKNMNKTLSNRQKKLQMPTNKKVTKLRHV